VDVDEETPMNDTIEKFGIFAISLKSHIRPVVIMKIGRISKKENKLVNLRYIGYITAIICTKIFVVVAETGLQVYKSTQICVLINLPIFAILQKFSNVTPVKFSG